MKDLFEEIKEFYTWLIKFLTVDLWNFRLQDLSKAKRRGIRYLRVAYVTIMDVGKDNLGLFSIALSFFTTMAVVPFVACSFAVTSGVGLASKLEELLHQSFAGNEEMVDYVIKFAGNIINDMSRGIFGVISFLFFMGTIVWLIINVERAFNIIWKVERKRSLTKRFLYYVGILLVGPFIVLIFLSIYLFFSNVLSTIGIGFRVFPEIGDFLQWCIFYGVVVVAFTGMYKYIPSVKVHFAAAFNAALITAFAFVVIQFLYLETQLMVSRLSAVYGAFAAMPLFLIWLNISWTTILIGAEISHAFQYVDKHEFDTKSTDNKSVDNKSVENKSIGDKGIGEKSVREKDINTKNACNKSIDNTSNSSKKVSDKSAEKETIGNKSTGNKTAGNRTIDNKSTGNKSISNK